MKPIVVGCDGSEPGNHALAHAVGLSQQLGAPLHLVYVIPPVVFPMEVTGYAAAELLERHRAFAQTLMADVAKKVPAGVVIGTEIREGGAAEQLVAVAAAKDASMVVVGNTGRGAAGRILLGSVADRVVHTCTRPVLVVR